MVDIWSQKGSYDNFLHVYIRVFIYTYVYILERLPDVAQMTGNNLTVCMHIYRFFQKY